ncbi:MAG: VWA domain-containing protein [Pseudomonadota bacterium]
MADAAFAASVDDLWDQGVADWQRALRVAAVAGLGGPSLGGVVVRGWAGPVRDAWVDAVSSFQSPATPERVIHPQVDDGQLLGGLALGETLAQGKPVFSSGLLSAAHLGRLQVRMAERLRDSQITALCAALDEGCHRIERDGWSDRADARFLVVAFDESEPDEQSLSRALQERLALSVDLHRIAPSVLQLTRELLVLPSAEERRVVSTRAAAMVLDDTAVHALCSAALQLGLGSLRLPQLAARTAKLCAAIDGKVHIDLQALEESVALVYTHRAQALLPTPAEDTAPVEEQNDDGADVPPPPDQDKAESAENELEGLDPDALTELLLAAAQAPATNGLLDSLVRNRRERGEGPSGRSGPRRRSYRRGAPATAQSGSLRSDRRLDVPATLRAAAPWQPVRGQQSGKPVRFEADDVRVKRYNQRASMVTLFVVDASGSAAMQRLAEAKGCVERLLAECYVRRDQVALVAFRGRSAELTLPPTRSLVRAKRALAALPAGGGTPLAAGLSLGLDVAQRVQRTAAVPMLVLLTDGRPNVALDGRGQRQQAAEEAERCARLIGAGAIPWMVVDCAVRGQRFLEELAELGSAAYLRLPRLNDEALSQAVQNYGQSFRSARHAAVT